MLLRLQRLDQIPRSVPYYLIQIHQLRVKIGNGGLPEEIQGVELDKKGPTSNEWFVIMIPPGGERMDQVGKDLSLSACPFDYRSQHILFLDRQR